MKFSILIPTKNRLKFLKYALNSVLHQREHNWEVIVSDNCSEEAIEDYISSLAEKRIFYSRSDTPLSVTENWNRALEFSSGDYVIMLGDDDCLIQDYFTLVSQLLSNYENPDFIYSRSLLFAYPGVIQGNPQGNLIKWNNWGLWRSSDPFWLKREQADKLIQETLNFRVTFTYNMQFATIRRSFIETLKAEKKFFHSPYPDYYAMTLMMLKGEKILASPLPLTIVGITPKSFGFYYFNEQEEEGAQFLNHQKELLQYPHLKSLLLPGSAMNTCWLYALDSVIRNSDSSQQLKVNIGRYRALQAIKFLEASKGESYPFSKVISYCALMNLKERMTLGSLMLLTSTVTFLLGAKWGNRVVLIMKKIWNPHPSYSSVELRGHYKDIGEIFEKYHPLDV